MASLTSSLLGQTDRGAKIQAQVEREEQVLALRFAGDTFRTIGRKLGFSASRAYYVYRDALRRRAVAAGSEKIRAREIARIETLLKPEMALLLGPPPADPEQAAAHAGAGVIAFDRVARLLPLLYSLHGFTPRPINVNIGRQAGANVREAHVHLHPRDVTPERRAEVIAMARALRGRPEEPGIPPGSGTGPA